MNNKKARKTIPATGVKKLPKATNNELCRLLLVLVHADYNFVAQLTGAPDTGTAAIWENIAICFNDEDSTLPLSHLEEKAFSNVRVDIYMERPSTKLKVLNIGVVC